MCPGHTQTGALCSTDRELRFAEEMTGPGLWAPQGSSPGCRGSHVVWGVQPGLTSGHEGQLWSHRLSPSSLGCTETPAHPAPVLPSPRAPHSGTGPKVGGVSVTDGAEGPAGAGAGPGRMVEGPWGPIHQHSAADTSGYCAPMRLTGPSGCTATSGHRHLAPLSPCEGTEAERQCGPHGHHWGLSMPNKPRPSFVA